MNSLKSTATTGRESNGQSTVVLESGFSLSEQAHEHDGDVAVTDGNKVSVDTASSVIPTVEGIDSSIEHLRQRIVNDVVGYCSYDTPSPAAEQSTLSTIRTTGSSTGNGNGNGNGNGSVTVTSPLEFQPGKPAILPLVYCDFTASHRPLKSIESYLAEACLPFYGNTHTNTSLTGSQSTAFCSEARQIVGEICGAKTTGKASQDVVLFA